MSETLERRRVRLAELEARDWVHVDCTRCGAAGVVAAPSQEDGALCGGCRLHEASLATAISRLPAETPPDMVRSGFGASGPENGSERVELVPPELVCSGEFCHHEMPAPVRELRSRAAAYRWHVQVRHSRGRPVGGNGKQLAVAEMWSVRFRRGTWAGYAVRRDDAWESVCITGAALPPFLALGVTELKDWLADPEMGGALDAWVAGIKRKVAAAALHAKQVACPGTPRCVPQGPGKVVAPEHTHRASGAIVIKNSRKGAQHGQ